jgi:iron(III) transport system substrate-binding protein
MITRRSVTLAGLAGIAGCSAGLGAWGSRFGITAGHSRLRAQAAKEGALRVDFATGLNAVDELKSVFERENPGIAIEYRRDSSRPLHQNFLHEVAAGLPTADMLISSAMDLQFKLINDGYAQSYDSPESPQLPAWAVWKDQAYAITSEPLVFVYNKRLMPPEDVPGSHEELADLLRRKPDEYRGKIASYDPELSGTGYLYHTQDLMLSRDTLDLVQAVGRTQPKFYDSGAEVRNRVSSGEHLLGYNMVYSYMVVRRAQHPDIGIVFPSDYTLAMSRVAFITKTARHPAASKLFLDFLLSARGQDIMARQLMQPIRDGIPMSGETPSPEILRPIHFGPSLLANLDEVRRGRVLRAWRRALES